MKTPLVNAYSSSSGFSILRLESLGTAAKALASQVPIRLPEKRFWHHLDVYRDLVRFADAGAIIV
jgi:hypothetical protein